MNYTDDLSRVLDDATVTTPPAWRAGAGLTVSADHRRRVHGHGHGAGGGDGDGDVRGDGEHARTRVIISSTTSWCRRGRTPPAECLPTDPACTTHPVPALVVTKSAVPVSTTTVNEGQVITYTLTFSNTAGQAPAPVELHR